LFSAGRAPTQSVSGGAGAAPPLAARTTDDALLLAWAEFLLRYHWIWFGTFTFKN
jgi:hypothetical protein